MKFKTCVCVCVCVRLVDAVRELERLKARVEDREQEVAALNRKLQVFTLASVVQLLSYSSGHELDHIIISSSHEEPPTTGRGQVK